MGWASWKQRFVLHAGYCASLAEAYVDFGACDTATLFAFTLYSVTLQSDHNAQI